VSSRIKNPSPSPDLLVRHRSETLTLALILTRFLGKKFLKWGPQTLYFLFTCYPNPLLNFLLYLQGSLFSSKSIMNIPCRKENGSYAYYLRVRETLNLPVLQTYQPHSRAATPLPLPLPTFLVGPTF
jgi:hypothetical protein